MTQIVLHRTGYDPDFRLTKRFDIDVEPLLSKLYVDPFIAIIGIYRIRPNYCTVRLEFSRLLKNLQ